MNELIKVRAFYKSKRCFFSTINKFMEFWVFFSFLLFCSIRDEFISWTGNNGEQYSFAI